MSQKFFSCGSLLWTTNQKLVEEIQQLGRDLEGGRRKIERKRIMMIVGVAALSNYYVCTGL